MHIKHILWHFSIRFVGVHLESYNINNTTHETTSHYKGKT